MSDVAFFSALRVQLGLPGVDVVAIADALTGYDLPPGASIGDASTFIISEWLKH